MMRALWLLAFVCGVQALRGEPLKQVGPDPGEAAKEFHERKLIGLQAHRASGTNSVLPRYFTGATAGELFGQSVADAGDVNGDGYHDVIVGAMWNSVKGFRFGRAYIYLGGPGMDAIPDVILNGDLSNSVFGNCVAGVGDVNADGYDDVIVGASLYGAGNSYFGRAYIYLGGAAMDSTADAVLTEPAAISYFGSSVSGAGDVNGDGYSDVIMGSPGTGTHSDLMHRVWQAACTFVV